MNKKELADKIRNASGFSNDEKAALLELVNRTKKYGLVWEDKPEDVHEQLRTYIPVFKEVKEKAVIYDPADEPSQAQLKDNELFTPDDDSDPSKDKPQKIPNHILIESDNFQALIALQYSHLQKVDFIYIDPPYNTGAKDWKYNNHYVDENDAYRHSKWIGFLDKRLRVAKSLLKDDGIICVTIDDYELPRLWMLLEDIFGHSNHLGTVVIRNNPKGRMTKRKFSLVHEYAVFYGKSELSYIKKLPEEPEDKTHNYIQDEEGNWYLPINLRKQGVDSNAVNKNGILSERFYPIYYDPITGQVSSVHKLDVEIWPIDSKGVQRIWRRSKDIIDEMYENGSLWVQETSYGLQVYFKFLGGLDGKLAQSIWTEPQCSASDYGTKILDAILGEREKFQYPKAPFAVSQSILCASHMKDAVILDFFAGSGTTLQAVMELNAEDGGNRQCILVTNNENNICEEVTYERNKRVIQGYTTPKGNRVEGLRKNNLRYFKTELLDREENLKNFKELTRQSTDLLRIKEDCYNEVHLEAITPGITRLFENDNIYMMIIFDDRYIDECIPVLKDLEKKTKVYVFAYGQYPYTDDFEEVLDKIELCAIPDAIYEAYQPALPPKKAPVTDRDEEAREEAMFGEEE